VRAASITDYSLSAIRIMSAPRTNIVLIGFMGSGKSSIGKLVAQRMGFQFADTDALIVERSDLAITQLFALYGETHFRELETGALESCRMRTRTVLATGGGVVLREENRTLLRELGFVVQLTASEETLFERVSRNRKRPLLHTADPRATVHEMFTARQPLYDTVAQFTVDSTQLSHSGVAEAIIEAARAHFGW
jgi:shikimate kinase